MAKWHNPLADTKPTTVGIFCLTALWALFQWKDPTPPPVLDQILVASFGVWFANEAIDKKNSNSKRSIKIDKDGGVSVTELPDETPKAIEGKRVEPDEDESG